METAAGLGEFGRAPGGSLLFRLTEALCELSCVEDQPGRVFFAGVLADQLNVHVDLRGTRQREDVIALVRASLSVPDGERALVDVVRLFEGSSVAAEFEQLLTSGNHQQSVSRPLPGPLTRRDTDAALALLDAVDGQLPGAALRDGLSRELHLEMPPRLTPGRLFVHLTELNVQPDGLPPAVLLIEHAAGLIRAPGWQNALSSWARGWAERSGLLTALERRRAHRVRATPDPTIPRSLVVTVEPAGDGSGDIVVRPWLNTVPGYWQPQPSLPETISLDGLGDAVERALRQVVRLASGLPDSVPDGAEASPPYVEFVLPYTLLNHNVAGLTVRSGDGKPLPLGLKYAVHLRSLERMRTDDVLVRAQWQERWTRLQSQGIAVHGWRASDTDALDEWQAALAAEPGRTAAVLDAPDGGPATEALKAAIAEGVALAVWDRRGTFLEERREVVTAVFAAVQRPTQLPLVIHRLRRRAELDAAGPLLLGRHIAFFWDDPNRLVDIQTAADHDPADESAIGQPDSKHTTDSEEAPV
ncbi:effector-associated domain 2-containing protein [Streptomyces sp. CA-179760]|uniref:VMAP-C domain-containing protein n=1 Tax=Streptomyces sp. CA-179760 TaxID=3240054 RepID=UPI003D8F2666